MSSPAFAARDSLLDSAPTHQFPASTLPRWKDILSTHVSDIYNAQNPNIDKWQAFIQTLEGESKLRQILQVNAWFKQFSYKQDNWVYNQDDYWATPTEFLMHGGDCEDYAIIKYMTLRKLGFAPKDMKIAIVYDVYSGTDHAFLTVEHEGAEFVLDNREKVAVSRYMKNRYKPHYALMKKTCGRMPVL